MSPASTMNTVYFPKVEDGFSALPAFEVERLYKAFWKDIHTQENYTYGIVGSGELDAHYTSIAGMHKMWSDYGFAADSYHPIAILSDSNDGTTTVSLGAAAIDYERPNLKARNETDEQRGNDEHLLFRLFIHIGQNALELTYNRAGGERVIEAYYPSRFRVLEETVWDYVPGERVYCPTRRSLFDVIAFGHDAITELPQFEHFAPFYEENVEDVTRKSD